MSTAIPPQPDGPVTLRERLDAAKRQHQEDLRRHARASLLLPHGFLPDTTASVQRQLDRIARAGIEVPADVQAAADLLSAWADQVIEQVRAELPAGSPGGAV